jgi:hypothetical protein
MPDHWTPSQFMFGLKLHLSYTSRCGFLTRVQWLHFYSKRSRIEDAGDFIGFPELIPFVYFKTPEFTGGQEFPKRL